MVNLLVDAKPLDLRVQLASHVPQTVDRRDRLQQRLLLLDTDRQVRRDRVGQAPGVRDAHRGEHRLVGQARRVLDVTLEQAAHARHQLAHLRRDLRLAVDQLDDHLERTRVVLVDLEQTGALDTLDQKLDVAVGQLEVLDDRRRRPDRVDLFGLRVVDRRVSLRGKKQLLVRRQRPIHREQRGLAAHDEGDHRVRKDDDIPQRDHR
jgi:hypothetical protein